MSNIPPSDWTWIDAAARRFEQAWKSGTRPRIEDFLDKSPAVKKPFLLQELVRVEEELRRREGEVPTAAEYRRRFPDYEGPIASVFGEKPKLPDTPVQDPGPGMKASHSPAASRQWDALRKELAKRPDYEIVRELGAGGMGVVYLAHNRVMARDEVLKVVGREIVDEPDVANRFLREIRAVAKLRHPNIVSAYTTFDCAGSLVFAMEYVQGLDLRKVVASRGPMPVGHACGFLHQAALGLQHAHEEGMVHRDIKPGNLMLSFNKSRAVIKVLDFGLAKAGIEHGPREIRSGNRIVPADFGTKLTLTGYMLGTPDFVAPEQIVDSQQADIRADIYSLGCTLYFLLSGRPPFQGDMASVLQAHQSSEPEPLDSIRGDVPVELAAIVARMMAKNPISRFQVPAEVAQALAPFFKNRAGAGEATEFDSLRGDRSRALSPSIPAAARANQKPPANGGPLITADQPERGVIVIQTPTSSLSRYWAGVTAAASVAMLTATIAWNHGRNVAPPPIEIPAPDQPARRPPVPAPEPDQPQHDESSQVAEVLTPKADAPKAEPPRPAAPIKKLVEIEKKTESPAAEVKKEPIQVAARKPEKSVETDSTPAGMLNGRGLKKAGLTYVLDAERDILDGWATIQPLYVELHNRFGELQTMIQKKEEYDKIEQDYILLTKQWRDVREAEAAFPTTSNSMLKQQWRELLDHKEQLGRDLNALDTELDLRFKNLEPDWKREKLIKEYVQKREEYLLKSRILRTEAEQVNRRYAKLDEDDAVNKAIAQLRGETKTRVELGPSVEFKKKTSQLKEAERNVAPSGAGRKTGPRQSRKKTKAAPSGGSDKRGSNAG